jgi:hypothetical protein
MRPCTSTPSWNSARAAGDHQPRARLRRDAHPAPRPRPTGVDHRGARRRPAWPVGVCRRPESDLDAVTRGLTTRWNSGPVEDRVNHIKMINGRCSAGLACRCSANESCSPRRDADALPMWPVLILCQPQNAAGSRSMNASSGSGVRAAPTSGTNRHRLFRSAQYNRQDPSSPASWDGGSTEAARSAGSSTQGRRRPARARAIPRS